MVGYSAEMYERISNLLGDFINQWTLNRDVTWLLCFDTFFAAIELPSVA